MERGALKIFFGYAEGVGTSSHLFEDGRDRSARGEDVVVACVQSNAPADVAAIAASLEWIPPQNIRGIPIIDMLAVRHRCPEVCLIDGLACDNPLGTPHAKRYEDVEELLDNGINVLTSIDLESIEEQQAFVQSVSGRTHAPTVPQRVIEGADELVLVDTAPHVLFAKSAAAPETDRARCLRQLSRLRERARQITADVVDRQLDTYLARQRISPHECEERMLVWMTPDMNAAAMLAGARREADCSHGTLFAVCLRQPNLAEAEQAALAQHFAIAGSHHAHLDMVEGTDPTHAILEYARTHRITRLFVGRDVGHIGRLHFGRTSLDRLMEHADDLDIRVFPDQA